MIALPKTAPLSPPAPLLFIALLIFSMLFAYSPECQGSVDQQAIVSEGGTVYVYHIMSAEEVQGLRDSLGTMDHTRGYNPIIGGHGTGLAPPDEDGWSAMIGTVQIDYALIGAQMPPSVRLDLDPRFPPIGDQGTQGSCTAWASVYYAGTFLQAKIHGWTDVRINPSHVMSPAWTYNKINGGKDAGSWCDKNMRLVTEIGSASMATMPYNQYDWLSWGEEPAWREAPLYRAGGYATLRPDNIEAIKALINDGYLVTFYIDASFPWYSSQDRILSYGEYTGGSPNHANVIVGYDDSVSDGGDTGAFRVANSWGEGFKDGGFYWITYRTMGKIAFYSQIANSYLPKGGAPYQPLVLATWRMDPAGALDNAVLKVGVGTPESPLASKTPSDYWNPGKGSRIPNFMCLDITELGPYISSSNGEFFLSLGGGSSPSKITSFTVEVYSDYAQPPTNIYASREVPAWTPVTVAITERPSVIFSWSPLSPLTLEPVQFTDSSSSRNGTIVSRKWSFGDGSYSISKDPVHTYSYPGSYTVSLTVTDSYGLSSTRSQAITVKNRPPEVHMARPAGGGFFSGTIELAADASDLDGTISKVSFFYLAGDKVNFIGANSTSMQRGEWTFQWDTSPLTISGIQVYAVAYDGFDYSSPGYIDQPISLDNSPPSPPTPLLPKQGSRTDGQTLLSWSPPSDLGSGVFLYTVEMNRSGSGSDAGSIDQVLVETDRTSCRVELSPGLWAWRVRATDFAGNIGEWSPQMEFVADSFLVNESGSSSPRSDIGSSQYVWFRVFYQYDGSPFTPGNGTVFVNGSPASWNTELERWELPVSKAIAGEAIMHISAILDGRNPVTTINRTAPPASIIFDRVIVDRIDPSELRVQVGRQVNFSAFGHYEYDSAEWIGGFMMNDSSSKDSMGMYAYSVRSITDQLYNLTSFLQLAPPASVIFDKIQYRVDYETARPGECLVHLRLSYSYDGSPITSAASSITIGGSQPKDLGDGNYELALSTLLPYATIRSEIDLDNFDSVVLEEGVLLAGNAAVYAVSASAAAIMLALYFKRGSARGGSLPESLSRIKPSAN